MLKESLLRSYLKKFSRSFYITLVILPRRIFQPIAVAYLLARIADTITDTLSSVPFNKKRDFLLSFKDQIDNENLNEVFNNKFKNFLIELEKYPVQKKLVNFIPNLFPYYLSLNRYELDHVKAIVNKLINGMEKDLILFKSNDLNKVVTLDTFHDFDLYTYNVAGCVGEFWTEISLKKEKEISPVNYQKMIVFAIQFGKALQITNIIRDIKNDYAMDRCYIPNQLFSMFDLEPKDLIQGKLSNSAQKLLGYLIEINLKNYSYAIEYFLLIPKTKFRLRLACLIPILIGLKTIKKIASNKNFKNFVDHSSVKISRISVYVIIINAFFIVISRRFSKSYLYSTIDQVRSILNK